MWLVHSSVFQHGSPKMSYPNSLEVAQCSVCVACCSTQRDGRKSVRAADSAVIRIPGSSKARSKTTSQSTIADMYGSQPRSNTRGSVGPVARRSNGSSKWKQVGTTVAGNEHGRPGADAHHLNTPLDVVIDSKNQYFYVADHANGRIQRFPVNGAGGGDRAGVTAFKLENSTGCNPWNPADKGNKPSAICIDRNDNLYVAELYAPRRLLKITPNGTATTLIDPRTSILRSCSGIYVDKDDNIYVSDWQQSAVLKFDRNGKNGRIVAGGNGYGSAPHQLYHPMGIFVAEKTGNLYIADYINQCVRRWAPGSKHGVIVAGGNEAGAHLNQLNYPSAVIVDSEEKNVFVGDSMNARVMRWVIGAKQGEVIVGGNNLTSEVRQMCRVSGFKLDKDGNVYVADNYGNRVRKFVTNN